MSNKDMLPKVELRSYQTAALKLLKAAIAKQGFAIITLPQYTGRTRPTVSATKRVPMPTPKVKPIKG